jgi:hypothetical protein
MPTAKMGFQHAPAPSVVSFATLSCEHVIIDELAQWKPIPRHPDALMVDFRSENLPKSTGCTTFSIAACERIRIHF